MNVLVQEQGKRCIKSKYHCSFFFTGGMWCYDAFFVTKYVIMTSILILCNFLLAPVSIHSFFLRLKYIYKSYKFFMLLLKIGHL